MFNCFLHILQPLRLFYVYCCCTVFNDEDVEMVQFKNIMAHLWVFMREAIVAYHQEDIINQEIFITKILHHFSGAQKLW